MSKSKVNHEQFDNVISYIEDDGYPLRKALLQSNTPSNETFYKWIDGDEELAKRYARACEKRAEGIFEDILDIADDASNDVKAIDMGDGVVVEKVDYENIQRSKLRVDARKWMLAKMQPKKYSDRTHIDHTSDGEKIEPVDVGSIVKNFLGGGNKKTD